jgi:hypothetical protein
MHLTGLFQEVCWLDFFLFQSKKSLTKKKFPMPPPPIEKK